jgi:hypothetical protein
MPLVKTGSAASVGQNVKIEESAGRPYKQALAIALATKDRVNGMKVKAPNRKASR